MFGMKPLDKAISIAGGQSALAAAINGTPQLVNNWLRRKVFVPIEYCALIEMATGVTRRDLRPDDWHLIWPELVTAEFPAPGSVSVIAPRPGRSNADRRTKPEQRTDNPPPHVMAEKRTPTEKAA
jgi:DNA-binding transcriptional regulator YdaS (Cro superfamily)